MSEGVRRLFLFAALISVATTVPTVVATQGGSLLVLGLAASLLLCFSWVWGYLIRRAPLAWVLLDSASIVTLGLAFPDPNLSISILMAGLWFRSQYGRTWQAVVVGMLHIVSFLTLLPLWASVRGETTPPDASVLIGVLPTLVFTVIFSRGIGGILVARDESTERERVLAEAGAALLGGAPEAEAVESLGRAAAARLCAATPGLRLLQIARSGTELVVELSAGKFNRMPVALPAEILDESGDAVGRRLLDIVVLDGLAGAPLRWERLALEDQPDRLLLLGASRPIPADVLRSFHSLSTQIAMSLRSTSSRQELRLQATTDQLTGLSNRASFTDQVEAELASNDSDARLHMLFLDLDDFKDVNDALGHRAGDELLIDVAARLLRHTRVGDLCSRLGGDEFAILLRGSTEHAAHEIAQRLVDAIGEPFQLTDGTVQVRVSLGVASAAPGITLEELVHHADLAMYAAKLHGKGQVQVFQDELLRTDRRSPLIG